MKDCIHIADKPVGPGCPCFIVAEISANHNQSLDKALDLIRIAKSVGADAVKIQTYRPDTLTIDCDNRHFQIGSGTLWEGKTLFQLYSEAYMPWEWTGELMALAHQLGMVFFSTPFDNSSIDFLEKLDMPAYKVASFEIVHLPLLRKLAATGKPIILSTGMSRLEEIEDAVDALRGEGCKELILLKCTSAYPASPKDANLACIQDLAKHFKAHVGLSDHTLGSVVPIAAVTLGACLIEKHLTRSRAEKGPDSAFSLEPDEFRSMVDAVRTAEDSIGRVQYELSGGEKSTLIFRRSIFITEDTAAGQILSPENCQVIRPGHGLAPKFLEQVLGKKLARDTQRGTPLSWDMLEDPT